MGSTRQRSNANTFVEPRCGSWDPGRSRHELSGQRMKLKQPPASGRASALRVNIAATSTPIFKTRITPYRIAVRAEMEKLRNPMKNRTHFSEIWTSFGADRYRIQWFDHLELRFSENRTLKTENSQRHRDLRFPSGTGRSHSNGLLEQMPRSQRSTSFGSNGPHRHKPTPLIPDPYSASFVRTREVKA